MNTKVKAIDSQIVVHGTVEKPYYEISYYDTSDNKWHIGYSSYDLQTVKGYLDSCFEVVDADVEPVRHGEWIETYNEMVYSQCHLPPITKEEKKRQNRNPNKILSSLWCENGR